MRKKCLDLDLAEFTRVATVVEQHKPANPMDVSFFGPKTVVFQADPLPDDVQQHGFIRHNHVSNFLLVIPAPYPWASSK